MYMCMFSSSKGFCAFYCYDGLLRERPFEILAYVVAVVVIIVYTIGNFAFQFTRGTPEGDERTLKIVRFVKIILGLSSTYQSQIYM